PEARALYDKVLQARKTYTSQRAAAAEDKKKGDLEKANQFYQNDMPGLMAAYHDAVVALETFLQDNEARLFAQEQAAGNRMLMIQGLMTLLALICGILLAWRISRSITRPLDRTVQL